MSEQKYLDMMSDIMERGNDRDDRTGVGTRSVFGHTIRYDLGEGFPLLTTKKMDINAVLSELLWFIEGSTDERRLAEIRWGKDRKDIPNKKTIWTANAQADYWKPKAKFDGDLGRIYGHQWRRWETPAITTWEKIKAIFGWKKTTDQIANLVNGLKNDPNGRRHLLINYNPGEVHLQGLPACHVLAQFYVSDGKISCMYVMRSNDVFLGRGYNTVSYALLTHMLAHILGLEVGDLFEVIGDLHIYKNHFEAVETQLSRNPYPKPKLKIKRKVDCIFDFQMDDFEIEGYKHHPGIKAPMAV